MDDCNRRGFNAAVKNVEHTAPKANGLAFRTCQYQDLDRVVAVEKASFADRPYSKSEFIYLLWRAGDGFIIAEEDDSLLGYVIAICDRTDGIVQSIAVSPEFRRRGVGAALMFSALNHLAKCERVFLLVDANNLGAISLYRKLSFRETGRIIKRYYSNGHDAIEMMRTVDHT